MKTRSFFPLILLYLLLCISFCWAEEPVAKDIGFSYSYKGKSISLIPSKRLIALEEKTASFVFTASTYSLKKDPLSERYAVKSRSIGLYRTAVPPEGDKGRKEDLSSRAAAFSVITGANAQPVFEQGGAILIPFDEVIVGFKEKTSLSEAQSYLAPHLDTLGILQLRDHREKTFILRIGNPANGRSFQVARSLSGLEKISFSEPNFILLPLEETGATNRFAIKSVTEEKFIVGYTGMGEASLDLSMQVAPDWTAIASLDFESADLPLGWQVGNLNGSANAFWGATSYRKHGGSRSLYCAASGVQAVTPPGPVPINMRAVLRSPTVDLSSYKEVYVEFWFYTKNEMDPTKVPQEFYDYPSVIVFNKESGDATGANLVVANSGDLTLDPTTSNGWRRMLFRVPPSLRVANAFFDFQYTSDGSVQTEGAYIDDIRIVATADVDTEPLSNDPFCGRQYELKNVGQVAGLVNNRSDLHLPEAWGLVTVSPEIIVAVIDSGVELNHPDLNLVTGYDPDGKVGGQPRGTPRGSHGTGCAGNLGAIKDNGIGVVGTAPGVKIMPVYRGTTTAEAANAIDMAVAHGARILSNSWGWVGVPSADIENAIKAAIANGRIVLFAAGNGPDRSPYTYEVGFPGNLTATTDVICVGASSPTDEHKSASSSDGQFQWGSSYVGAGPDVCAPGPWSYTTDLLGAEGENDSSLINPIDPMSADYNPGFGGTSSSTPKVAGIVALMLSKNPNLTPVQVKSILMATADDIDEPGADDKTGAGRVNAYKAVLATPSFTTASTNLLINGDFESGNARWSQSSSGGFGLIYTDGAYRHTGSGYAWFGGYETANDILYQDVIIPASASSASVRFWYNVATTEVSTTEARDILTLVVVNPATGAVLQTLASLSNLNATAGAWVQSDPYNLLTYQGQTIRLKFTGRTNGTLNTNFFVDDMEVTASTPVMHTLTVNFPGSGSGTVTSSSGFTCSPDTNNSRQLAEGIPLILTAAVAVSSYFVGWSGDCATINGTDCSLTMNADKNVSANFAIKQYTVTFTAGTNGSITGATSQTVNHGGRTTAVTAVPVDGYHFVDWTGTNGFLHSTANPLSVINVTEDMTITANFALNETKAILTSDLSSPQRVGTTITFTSAATGGEGGPYEYRYWWRSTTAGSKWTVGQTYSTANTWEWNTATLGLPAGSYYIQVDTRHVGNLVKREALKTLTYKLQPVFTPAASVTLIPNPSSPRSVGTNITFTGMAIGGSAELYEYRFWWRSTTAGSKWTVGQTYTTTNTWEWNTSTPSTPAGSYYIQVDTRHVGSLLKSEATRSVPYKLVVPPTGVELTQSHFSPQPEQ